MILEMATTVLITAGAINSRGSSEAARYVSKRWQEGRRQLQASASLGLRRAFEELFAAAEQCASPNWDGYGSAAVSDETFRQACFVLESLPLGTLHPSVGAEPD